MQSKSATLQTIAFAQDYYKHITLIEHVDLIGQKKSFFANNAIVASYIKKNLTLESFSEIFAICQKNGTFDLHFNNSIPFVTFNTAAAHMTRKWPRDHMGMML